jgi:hypothetical protein
MLLGALTSQNPILSAILLITAWVLFVLAFYRTNFFVGKSPRERNFRYLFVAGAMAVALMGGWFILRPKTQSEMATETVRQSPAAFSTPSPMPSPPREYTLHDHYLHDFEGVCPGESGGFTSTTKNNAEGVTIRLERKVCYNPAALSKILVIYIPDSQLTLAFCQQALDKAEEFVSHIDEQAGTMYPPGERGIDLKNAQFIGRTFIYHEGYLSESEIDTLIAKYKKKGLTIQFRGHQYAFANRNKIITME